MVKFATAFFVAATIVGAVPSLAFDMPVDAEARNLDFINEDPVVARQFVEAVYGRELTDAELQEREPFFGLIFAAARIGAKIASKVASKVGRKAAHHAVDHHNRHKRSFEDDLELDSRAEFEGDLLEEREIYGEIIDERGIDAFDELD